MQKPHASRRSTFALTQGGWNRVTTGLAFVAYAVRAPFCELELHSMTGRINAGPTGASEAVVRPMILC